MMMRCKLYYIIKCLMRILLRQQMKKAGIKQNVKIDFLKLIEKSFVIAE